MGVPPPNFQKSTMSSLSHLCHNGVGFWLWRRYANAAANIRYR